MKKWLIFLIIVILAVLAGIYFYQHQPLPPPVEYQNSIYGFNISLPEDWRGYQVTIDKWTGYTPDDQYGEVPVTSGVLISIHHPNWTAENSYQDIPLMIFSLDQWKSLQEDKFHIGAAPINPSEIGRNEKYVFAIPARYNYAYPTGWEEVEQILQSKPFKFFSPISNK